MIMAEKPRSPDAEASLRRYLSENEFRPGDRLPTHKELCEILNVGSRPLREALSVLERQGLIVTRGRGGTIVSQPKDEHIVEPIKWYFEVLDVTDSELIEARAIIESAVVVEACRNRTTKDLLVLQQSIEFQAEPGIDRTQEIEFDKKFHLDLMHAAHNKVFNVFAKLILLQFDYLYQVNLYPDQDKIRVRDHSDILAAVYERDEYRAHALTKQHILRSLNIMRSRGKQPEKDGVLRTENQ